jgi:hypothetical protein
MEKTEKLTPIEGVFSHEDAEEILMNMYKSKINFHNIKNWSSQERFGKDDAFSQKRLPELRQDLERLKAFLTQAKAQDKGLIINSEIKLTFTD